MRHTFGTGEWVEAIPLQSLRMKHRDQLSELANEGTPMNADGDVDWAAIDALHGGRGRWGIRWSRRQRDIVIAMVLTKWSYDLPLPQINADGDPVNLDSIGETDPELAAFIKPYVEQLTREPSPKGTTTSGSNGSSPARAKASRTG